MASEAPYRVRARVLAGLFLVSFLLGLIAVAAFGWAGRPIPSPLAETTALAIPYVLMLLLVQYPLRRSGQSIAAVMGPAPGIAAIRWAVGAGAALFAFSVFSLFLVFLPLSYVAPAFVQSWLIDDPVTLVWRHGDYRLLTNAINMVTVCASAPFVEELVFRGMILPAWSQRIGLRWALVCSALGFAVLHAELVGTFVFSLVGGIAYMQTRMLWIPIVIHATNNTIAWLMDLVIQQVWADSMNTLESFQRSWWMAGAGLFGIPALLWLVKRIPKAVAISS